MALSLGRLLVPLVTGIPYITFIVHTYLHNELTTLFTTGEYVGLFKWTGSDSAYLTFLVLVLGSTPNVIYLGSYLIGVVFAGLKLWLTNTALSAS